MTVLHPRRIAGQRHADALPTLARQQVRWQAVVPVVCCGISRRRLGGEVRSIGRAHLPDCQGCGLLHRCERDVHQHPPRDDDPVMSSLGDAAETDGGGDHDGEVERPTCDSSSVK